MRPSLDPAFKPAITELRAFNERVAQSKEKQHLIVAVERAGGYIYRREFDILPDGVDDAANTFITERLIKSILWVIGGYKIYIAGSHVVYSNIKDYYRIGGLREFDYEFWSTTFETEVQVIECDEDTVPEEVVSSEAAGGHLDGRRIGFDVGGSDLKVSAVVDGKVISSEEVVWHPKTHEDIEYHYENLYKAMRIGVDSLGGDVDAIGISAAGVIVTDRPMVSSIFIKVPKKDFELVKYSYVNCVRRLEKELGHPIPYVVANDGDVTALAGAVDLHADCVLGIAMGTSEAGGYVDHNGNLTGWFSELAFVPIDFNENAAVDEWSKDFGVGCKYLSQDAVIKLLGPAGIEVDPALTPAEKLTFVQNLMEQNDPRAAEIFKNIGVYFAYALAFYAEFYQIKHVIMLGRVTSGRGGDIILETARKTLEEDFPEYAHFHLTMPSESMRRVGQSIAAASLPNID